MGFSRFAQRERSSLSSRWSRAVSGGCSGETASSPSEREEKGRIFLRPASLRRLFRQMPAEMRIRKARGFCYLFILWQSSAAFRNVS